MTRNKREQRAAARAEMVTAVWKRLPAAAGGGGGHGQSAGDDGATRDPAETIAAKYNAETELTAEVKSGANTFDFDLTSG